MWKSFLKLIVANALSKSLGFLREILFAGLFGTNKIADAFRLAQSVTLTPTHIFVSDTLLSLFVPFYRKLQSQNKRREAQALFNNLAVVLGTLALLLSLSIFLTPDFFIRHFSPGFDPVRINYAHKILKFAAFGIIFYTIGSLFMFLEMSQQKFSLAAIKPNLNNIFIIFAILLVAFSQKVYILGLAFTLCFLSFSLYGFFKLKSLQFSNDTEPFNLKLPPEVLREFLFLLLPLIGVQLLVQGRVILEKYFASFAPIGSIAAVDYSRFVAEFMVFVFGLPLSYIALSYFGENKIKEKKQIENIVAFLMVFMLPLSIFIFLNATIIVKLIFARGAFKEKSIMLTTEALKGFSPGIWAWVGAYFLQRVLSAYLENVKVLKFFLLFAVFDLALKIMLFPHLRLMGLTLAESSARTLFFFAILYDLGILGKALKKLLLSLPGVVILLFVYRYFNGYSASYFLTIQLLAVSIYTVFAKFAGIFEIKSPS